MKLLLLIMGLALLLRVFWLPQNLFFGFEQGRDMLVVSKIVNFEDFRLIGANTDIDGIFHGAFYYYFLAPLFFITGGDPLAMTYLLILLNVAGIYFLYRAAENLFGKKVAFVSSILYAVSYSAIIYSRWLSNPNPIPFFSILLFFSLVKSTKDKRFLYLGAVSWGLIFHLSLATAATLVLPTLLFLFVYKIRPNVKDVAVTLLTLFFVFSPYIVFDFRNNHLLFSKLSAYLGSGQVKNHIAAYELFVTEAVDNVIPFARNLSLVVIGITLLSAVSLLRRKEVLVLVGFVVLPTVLYSALGMIPIRHIYIALPPFLSILFATAFLSLARGKFIYLGAALLLLVVVANLWHTLNVLPESKGNFLQRSQRTYLGDEKKVLDFIYTSASGEPFSYEYFSVPWWKSEAWEYLFSWYGKNEYGHTPSKERTQVFYSIWEPDETKPIYKDNWYGELNTASNIIKEEKFGALGVEKREWKEKI